MYVLAAVPWPSSLWTSALWLGWLALLVRGHRMDVLFILGTDFLSLSCLFIFPPSSVASPIMLFHSFLFFLIIIYVICKSFKRLFDRTKTSSSSVFFPFFRPMAEGQSGSTNSLPTSIMVSLPTAPPPVAPAPARTNNSLANRKPGVLPANLEDMKVFGSHLY